MIVLAVTLVVDPANADTFAARIKQHATNSLTQSGCLGFVVMHDNAQKGRFCLWETYADAAAVQAHRDADFMAEFQAFAKDYVKERVLHEGTQITS
jgi:autoinducer 2-degrading protein